MDGLGSLETQWGQLKLCEEEQEEIIFEDKCPEVDKHKKNIIWWKRSMLIES